MELNIKNLYLVALIAALGVAAVLLTRDTPTLGGLAQATTIGNASTTVISVTSSKRILATTTSGVTRVRAEICNVGSNPVYVLVSEDKNININTGGGFPIAAAAGFESCYVMSPDTGNLSTGSVKASSTAQTATSLYVTEWLQ